VANHPPWGGSATPAYFPSLFFLVFGFFFQKRKKKGYGGILGIKRPNVLNCHNLKVWGGGGLSVTFETLEAKVKMGGYFKGVKCNFPAKYYIFDSL
jgi:hypothetical protein